MRHLNVFVQLRSRFSLCCVLHDGFARHMVLDYVLVLIEFTKDRVIWACRNEDINEAVDDNVVHFLESLIG